MAGLLQKDSTFRVAQRSNGIDALRGLAALIIVVYHARPMFWVGLRQTWDAYGLSLAPNAVIGYLSAPFSFGGLAVDFFFVLSGYCIHRKGAYFLAQNTNKKLNLKKYFTRRFLRIYPVYIAALVLTAVVHLYVASTVPSLIENQDNSWFSFLVNLLSLQGIFAPSFAHNSVFWTLAIEIHLYVIYPLIYYFLSRISAKLVLLSFATISFSYILLDEQFNLFSHLFPYKGSGGPLFIPYLFAWGIGIYLAEIKAGRQANIFDFKVIDRKSIAIFIFVLTFLSAFSLRLAPNFLSLLLSSLCFAWLIYWSQSEQGESFWSGKIGKIAAYLGLFSYSLYATHRPFLLLIKSWIDPTDHRFFSFKWVSISIFLCIVCAFIFFNIFERWFLKSCRSKPIRQKIF